MLHVPENYFESEVREGYFVPAFMKRSWAVMLEVLSEISLICTRHNLKWWMDWGSLLATVRHGGFIPWDDDVDINQYAKDELPEGFYVNNIHNNYRFDEYHTLVLCRKEIDENGESLKRTYGFPYLGGVDLFCIDYVNPDEEIDRQLCNLIYTIGSVATGLSPDDRWEDIPQFHQGLLDIEAITCQKLDRSRPLRQQINLICEKLMQTTTEQEAAYATCMVNHATHKGFQGVFPKEYYRELIVLPFEFLEVPAPLHYDEMLKTIFGNYMTPVRSGGLHDYPYFGPQEEVLLQTKGKIRREVYSFKGL